MWETCCNLSLFLLLLSRFSEFLLVECAAEHCCVSVAPEVMVRVTIGSLVPRSLHVIAAVGFVVLRRSVSASMAAFPCPTAARDRGGQLQGVTASRR